jgi:hypothetical protein
MPPNPESPGPSMVPCCRLRHWQPVLSRIGTTLSRGGVMIETQHLTEPHSSFHRPVGRN